MNFIRMESHIGKVWADWKYIQNITLSFLAKAPHIKNKPAVFLALFFNNLFVLRVLGVLESSSRKELKIFFALTRPLHVHFIFIREDSVVDASEVS